MSSRTDYNYSQAGVRTYWRGTPLYKGPYTQNFSDHVRGWRTSSDVRRHKPRDKWVQPTAYSMEEVLKRRPTGTMTEVYDNPSYWWAGWTNVGVLNIASPDELVAYSGSPVLSLPAGLANRSLMMARLNLKDQKVNLGQAWAERRQVSRQVLDTASRLASAYSSLRKGRWKNACKALGIDGVKPATRSIASQWLGYQYGWKPLLSDIHGAVLALESRTSDRWMVTAKGTVSERLQNNTQYRANPELAFDSRSEGFFGCMSRIDAYPDSSAVASAASLGLLNPAQLAWELLPFSFIADWFVPVGDYLSQFDALAGWKVQAFSQSTFQRVRWKWQGVGGRYVGTGGWLTKYHNWQADYHITRLNRTVSTSVPFPMFPNIKDPVSTTHIANAIALMRTVFSKT